MKLRLLMAALTLIPLAQATARSVAGIEARQAVLRQIAAEAYIYLYPLLSMDIARRVQNKPANELNHQRTNSDASSLSAVRLNFDLLKSVAWIDLKGGPVVITVPASPGRHYLLQFLDMWIDRIATLGTRLNGSDALAVALVPRGWHDPLPRGATRIEASPMRVWMIAQTHCTGIAEVEAVLAFQNGKLLPLPARMTALSTTVRDRRSARSSRVRVLQATA